MASYDQSSGSSARFSSCSRTASSRACARQFSRTSNLRPCRKTSVGVMSWWMARTASIICLSSSVGRKLMGACGIGVRLPQCMTDALHKLVPRSVHPKTGQLWPLSGRPLRASRGGARLRCWRGPGRRAGWGWACGAKSACWGGSTPKTGFLERALRLRRR